jgi:Tol biopolymer transport system component
MSRYPLFTALICFLAVGPAAHAGAEEAATDSLHSVADFLDWERVSDPQISPDGKQVIYTRRWVNQLTDRWESQLWIMNADGSRNRFLTTKGCHPWRCGKYSLTPFISNR